MTATWLWPQSSLHEVDIAARNAIVIVDGEWRSDEVAH